jgi:hypothetical protein
MRPFALVLALILLTASAQQSASAAAIPGSWAWEWKNTDFERSAVDFGEIMSGGPPKDGIPAIDRPKIARVAEIDDLPDTEPVISVFLNGEKRAYPVRILMWHEIVNDTLGGVPIAVTFCPLCNSAVVFDRRVNGRVLDFGTTGKLRNSDLVMYDRQTESWWQQFVGEAIVGEMTGTMLTALPVRVESFARFKQRVAGDTGATVLVPNQAMGRNYGINPYANYDSASRPFLYRGDMPANIAPLARVVVVDREAWSLDLVRQKQRLEQGDLVITWEPGQNSALDSSVIARGRDIGNVVVQRRTDNGLEDAVHDISFAFAFHAFYPDNVIHTASD